MMQKRPLVTIVMATFNGETYLHAQLNSLIAQTFTDWQLLISDDGSSDQTHQIIRQFQVDNPTYNITLIDGPRQGFCQNFLTALGHELCRDCTVAFCDQDDVWHPEKLERAVAHLQNDIPRAYGSVVQMTDGDLNVVSETPVPKYPLNFANLLVENCIVGNTVVLNALAVQAIVSQPLNNAVQFHDWWALLVTSGVGGAVYFDPRPSVLYRQHGQNVLGAANGVARRRRNLAAVMGAYQMRVQENVNALSGMTDVLTTENQAVLALLNDAVASGWKIAPIYKMLRGGIHRQRRVDTLFMCLALLKT
jgi:glycosyltransferase involved in cell wall biosynthesis